MERSLVWLCVYPAIESVTPPTIATALCRLIVLHSKEADPMLFAEAGAYTGAAYL